jgi:hypothetical protein
MLSGSRKRLLGEKRKLRTRKKKRAVDSIHALFFCTEKECMREVVKEEQEHKIAKMKMKKGKEGECGSEKKAK